MKLNIDRSKREIIEEAEAMERRYRATLERQVDSINRLLGHNMEDRPPVPRYESELMDLNDRLAKADVQLAAYLDIIVRVRQHAQHTGNDRLLEIVGDVGKEARELASVDSAGTAHRSNDN